MAAVFPGGIKSFTDKTDNVDDVMAAHVNEIQDEVAAIEAYILNTIVPELAEISHLYFSRVSAFLSTTQTLANAVWTKINFNTELIDSLEEFSGARFTALYDGSYEVACFVSFVFNSKGYREVAIYKNGAPTNYRTRSDPSERSNSDTIQNLSAIVDLAVGDYIEIYAYQNRGGSLNLNVNETNIGIVRIL
jgi:hypothetical protein